MNFKRTISAILLLLFSLASASYAELGERYEEKEGGFSIRPPKSWQITEFPGLKYHLIKDTTTEGFTPNINFLDQQYKGSLKAYVDLNITLLKSFLNNFKVVSRDNFTTDDKLSGVKVVVLDEQYENKLRQTFYFFEKGDWKIVITCTVFAKGGDAYDSIFDESLKTFKLLKIDHSGFVPVDNTLLSNVKRSSVVMLSEGFT